MATDIAPLLPNQPLLYDWVPKGLGILILALLLFPIMLLNGAYSSNAAEMVAGLGVLSEHIMYATFVSSIGMMMAAPYIMSVSRAFGPRRIYIIGLSAMLLLSLLCGYSHSILLLTVCNFLTGVVRGFVLFNTVFCILKQITGVDPLVTMVIPPDATPEETREKNKGRSLLQCVAFCGFVTINQLGAYWTTKIAYEFRWQYSYWFMAIFVLVGLLSVLCIMRPNHSRKREWKHIEWPPFVQWISVSLFFLSLTYVFVYGKTYDWLDDNRIVLAVGLGLISLGTFVVQMSSGKRLIDPRIFEAKSVRVVIVFFTLLMVLNASSALNAAYMGIAIKMDSVKSAVVGNWQILGFFIAMVINFIMLKRDVHSRWFIVGGLSFMTSSVIYMYFHYQSMATYESMILPTVLRATGMYMIYGYCSSYGRNDIDAGKQFCSWIFVMLIFRGVVGPASGAAIYNNAIYHRSQNHIVHFMQESDKSNSLVSLEFENTHRRAMMQGKSYEEATQMASTTLKGAIQRQAMLVTLKEITGYTIYAGMVFILLALFYPYEKRGADIPATPHWH
ncbi:MAG: MFS transporter [Bacteroides sp.]|nr:MFS transporter [Bacteroides sp.]